MLLHSVRTLIHHGPLWASILFWVLVIIDLSCSGLLDPAMAVRDYEEFLSWAAFLDRPRVKLNMLPPALPKPNDVLARDKVELERKRKAFFEYWGEDDWPNLRGSRTVLLIAEAQP